MQNIKLTLQYDGTRYQGWQRPQKDGYEKTVSYKILSVLQKMTGEDILLHAGAKTEPGVHALSQTVSFLTGSALSPEQFCTNLNRYLPQDIAVLEAEPAPERFRSDLNAKSRTYEYRVCTSKVYDIFSAPYTAHFPFSFDQDAMEKAAGLLKGRHNFNGFCGVRRKKGTEKNLLDIQFNNVKGEMRKNIFPDSGNTKIFVISLTADDFLYQMPLRIVSVLLEIGTRKRRADDIARIFSGEEASAVSCEAKGLLLRSIQY